MNSNRGTNRRRGRNNNRSQSGRGPEQANRIDSRARGNANQLLEKYKKLAHDAQVNGDRVNTEYYLQFADHYFRVLADNRLRQEEARQKRDEERPDRNDYRSYNDDDDSNSYDDADQNSADSNEEQTESVAEAAEKKPARGRGRSRAPAKKSAEKADDSNGLDPSALPPSIGNDDGEKAKPAPRKRTPRKRVAAEEQELPQAANG